MELTRYHGNFVNCKKRIESANQRVATAQEGMFDRIKQGASSSYKNSGCWHPEGTARINGINYWCLAEYSPTTKYAKETLEANKRNEYLSLTDKIKLGRKPASQLIREIAEADAKLFDYEKRILIPKKQETFSVDSETLGDVDIAVFLARSPKLAERYGEFLKKCGINSVSFYQIENNYDNVASGFWLHGLGGDCGVFGFGGYGRGFDTDYFPLFGVAKR